MLGLADRNRLLRCAPPRGDHTARRRALAGLEGRLDHQCPGASNWVSEGTPSPFCPATSPRRRRSVGTGAVRDPIGFADYSLGHTLAFGHDYGLGNIQATFGVRMAEPPASNWFTPSLDPRRYLGSVRVWALKATSRWNHPGSSSGRSAPRFCPATARSIPVAASSIRCCRTMRARFGVNVDGLLGLSYWFDTASKLTVGYRADYFKGSPALNITGARRKTPTASITGR